MIMATVSSAATVDLAAAPVFAAPISYVVNFTAVMTPLTWFSTVTGKHTLRMEVVA